MYNTYRIIKELVKQKKGEIPGWAFIIGLILAIIGLVVGLWIMWKSGKVGAQQILRFR